MVTLAQVLRSAGYRTSISGKWNCQRQDPRSPLDWGFEEYYGFADMPSNYFNPALRDLKFGGFRPPIMDNRKPVSKFPKDYYVTDAINDHAIKMIRECSKSKDPFFVYVAHLSPHSPLQAKPEDIEKYRGKFMEGWDLLRKKRHQRQVEMGLVDPAWKLPEDDPNVSPWDQEKHKEWQDLRMAVYAAMIDRMDQGVGRILQTLRECGVERNTVVVFLSDNGGASEEMKWDKPDITPGGIDTYCFCGPGWAFLQNTPFRRFKRYLHEGGIATPLIVRWPGAIKGGTITHQVGHVIDIMPTLAELGGTRCPESWQGKRLIPVEGRSLVPVLKGGARQAHESLCWHGPHTGAGAVRQGRWKLVSEGVGNAWELYDMVADRTETNNLAGEQPERVRALADAWFAWAERTGAAGKAPARSAPTKKGRD
jgi:arylsulfatase